MYVPVIQEDKCSKCRRCANICPKGVFECREDRVCVWNPAYCTGCDSCTVVCEEDAIRVEEL
ncbi:MAG: 4Fe-4S binding protein [Thermodesulfobacteriota bacterium]